MTPMAQVVELELGLELGVELVLGVVDVVVVRRQRCGHECVAPCRIITAAVAAAAAASIEES